MFKHVIREAALEILSVAGIVGLALVGGALFLAVQEKGVPEWLSMAVGAIVLRFYNRPGNGSTPKEKDDASQGR